MHKDNHMDREKAMVAGIDLGGTNIEVGLIDHDGTVMARKGLPTKDFKDAMDFVKALRQALMELDPGNGKELVAIGLGAPNGNYYSGSIEHAPNLQWKGIVPLAKMVEEEMGVPTVLTNDANAAAIGEAFFGGAREMQNFISVTIGTGLGSGIYVDGELAYGHSGFAGELGHTIVVPGGRQCTCGRKGCLEAYVSARGLVDNCREVLKEHANGSPLAGMNGHLKPKAIFKAAQEGDEVAIKAFQKTGHYLGLSLANAAAILSPEAIFLFGGLMQAGSLLMDPTTEYLNEALLPILQGTVKIKTSSLNEENAAVLGAGALAWSEIGKLSAEP